MQNRSHFIIAAILLLFCSLNNRASAQSLPGKKDSINSAILNQKRFIQVVLPEDYKPGSTDKYDVIYVLDGDSNTGLMADVEQFISGENFMPKAIVVGVLNIDRGHDFTPTHEAFNPTSGGADKFLVFLKDELKPYIDKTYPTDGYNTIWGHSLGGLFVTYALLNTSQTFQSYIAADPSYWWANGYMVKQMASQLNTLGNARRTFFISGRQGHGMEEMAILPMDTVLKKAAPVGLNWKIVPYPNETHGTIRFKSMYDGLRFAYDGFGQHAPEFHPMSGVLLKGKPIKILDFDDSTKVRYTTDGSVPSFTSAPVTKVLAMPGPGTLMAKVFTSNEKFDKITTGVFKEGKPWTSGGKTKGFVPGSLHYAYYEGQWDKLPDFKLLKPVKEGIADKDFELGKLPRQTNFGVVFSGQIEIKEEGYYVFDIGSDDGSRFYLNNQLLLDDDGLHDSSQEKSYILPLKKGFYPVRLEYFQRDGGSSLHLVYLTPGMIDASHPKPINIPYELQYSGK